MLAKTGSGVETLVFANGSTDKAVSLLAALYLVQDFA
jgi:hypothetical protein